MRMKPTVLIGMLLGLCLAMPGVAPVAAFADEQPDKKAAAAEPKPADGAASSEGRPDTAAGEKEPPAAAVQGQAAAEEAVPKRGEEAREAGEDAFLEDGVDSEDSEDGEAPMSALAAAPLPEGDYIIRTALSLTKVFDIEWGSQANGANVQLYESNMYKGQRFTASVDAKGYYTFTNVGSGKVLDVSGAKAASGANVWQYAPNGTKAQKWTVEKNGDGSYVVKSALGKNLVLDIMGASRADGANVQIYQANGSPAQKIRFIKANPQVSGGKSVDDGIYEIRSRLDGGKVLDVQGASVANGAGLQLYRSNSTTAQRFSISCQDDGFYRIRPVNSGKALDVPRGNLVSTTKVQQWSSENDNKNQKWAIRYDSASDAYTFVSKANGLALDVAGASSEDGARVQVYAGNGTRAQQWSLKKVDSLVSEGVYTLSARSDTGLCLDVAGGSQKPDAKLQLWDKNGTPAQKFFVKKAGSDSYTVEALCSGLLLTANGKSLVQKKATGTDDQRWRMAANGSGGLRFTNAATGTALEAQGDGKGTGCALGLGEPDGSASQGLLPTRTGAAPLGDFVISSVRDGRVLDVAGASFDAGANVQAYGPNGTGAQKWRVKSIGGGWCLIKAIKSQKALDVANGSGRAGANVQQWYENRLDAQKWKFEYLGEGSYAITSACGGLALTAAGNGNIQLEKQQSLPSQKWRLSAAGPYPSENGDLNGRLGRMVYELGADGDMLSKAFNRVAFGYSYRSGSLFPEGDWSVPFAIEMHEQGSGNCYRFAALFCWLARYCGYDASVVSGWCPSASSGWTAHGWVEIKLHGQTYVCDPDMANAVPSRNWYMVTYANAPMEYRK